MRDQRRPSCRLPTVIFCGTPCSTTPQLGATYNTNLHVYAVQ